MNAIFRCFLFTTVMLFCTPVMSQYGAAGGSPEGLTAMGTTKLSLTPQWLEMSIEIEGRSSDLPQASEELKRRVDAAKERLAKLNAIADSVSVSKPSLKGEADPNQQRQMQQMMMQFGGGNKGREILEKTKSVSIVQTITARWQLPDDDDLSKMIASKELTDEIRAADVASSGDDQPVSAAQAELAEEMSAMMDQNRYGEETTKTGEPTFSYVAKLSAEEYQAAIKTAFQDAESQINNLAQATASPVQPTKPMMVNLGSGEEGAAYGYGYGQRGQQPKRQSDGSYELVANSPTEVACTVSVYAMSKHK